MLFFTEHGIVETQVEMVFNHGSMSRFKIGLSSLIIQPGNQEWSLWFLVTIKSNKKTIDELLGPNQLFKLTAQCCKIKLQ